MQHHSGDKGKGLPEALENSDPSGLVEVSGLSLRALFPEGKGAEARAQPG